MGAPAPLQISGQLTPAGFDLRLSGAATLPQLTPWINSFAILHSSLFSLSTPANSAPAVADLNLALQGPWMAPVNAEDHPRNLTMAQGSLRLQHVEAKLDWLPEPIEINSATASFSPSVVTWSNATFNINGVAVQGSATYPFPCENPAGCAARLTLDVTNLDAATLESTLLGTGHHGELIDAILSKVGAEIGHKPWPSLDSAAHIGVLSLGRLALRNARALVSVRNDQLKIDSLDADTLGGSLHASGTVETSGSGPQYSLDLNFSGLKIAEAANLFHENWGAGSIDGGAQLTLHGYSTADLTSSARGAFHWNWSQGSLPISANSASLQPASLTRPAAGLSPLHFSHWSANGTIFDGLLHLAPDASGNSVTGTISFQRELNLIWPAAKGQPLHLSGTLAHPALAPATPSVPNP